MPASIWRVAVWSLLLGLGAAVLFSLHVTLRGAAADGLLLLEQAALVALLTGLTACATAAVACRRGRDLAHQLADSLAAFCANATANTTPETPPQLLPDRALAGLFDAVRRLCALYRQALADCVQHQQKVERLKFKLDAADSLKGQRLTVLQRTTGSSRNMVARLTPTLHWLTATPALQRLLGRPLAELNGHSFLDVVHPDDAHPVQAGFAEALQTGERHHLTARLLAGPRREERHVLVDVLTRYTDEGSPEQFRCYLIDITDRIRAEQELRRRTEELSQANERLAQLTERSYDLYNNAPVMYFSLDAQGRLVFFNDTLLRTLGFERRDLLRQPYTRLLPPESRDAFEQAPAAYQRADQVETRWLKSDGTIIDVWILSEPLCDSQGRFIRSRSAAQDVTERSRLANELRRRRDELEQANAGLRKINAELDAYNYVVSHDLKEPLNTLEAYSQDLAREFSLQLGPDGFECINHLLSASRRLKKRIEDLLKLSRIGRVTRAPQPFDLNAAVAQVRQYLGDLMQRKEASFHTEGPLPTVLGDPEGITQLVMNLVSNGLKYNRSATPRVCLGQATDAADPGWVTLYVRDNGIGIDPQHHEQIFNIFQRLHLNDEFEGTGAGLAICKRIVEAHGGRLWVESQPGQGAAFYFTLPRAPEKPSRLLAETRLNGRRATEALPPPPAPAVPGARLLLVEDMAEIGRLVERFAQRAGFQLTWLTSAEAAWDYLQQERPDLMLLDRKLPGMDGIALCEKLRTVPALANLRIALFTQVTEDDIEQGLAAGANVVLSKELLCEPLQWQRRIEALLRTQPPDVSG